MTPDSEKPGPDSPAPAHKMIPTTTSSSHDTAVDRHGAEIAEDAAQAWKVHAFEHAIRNAADTGRCFAADEIEAEANVSGDGNWVGGIFMRLHRQGVIRRVGYRPSSKRSRQGSVVCVWVGVASSESEAA